MPHDHLTDDDFETETADAAEGPQPGPTLAGAGFRLTGMVDYLNAYPVDFPVWPHPGWETRGRSGDGGYYLDKPTYLMLHHDASTAGQMPANAVPYLADGSDIAPVYNLYVGRDAVCYVIAAGPTNNAGEGQWGGWPNTEPVPDDDMNRNSVALCLANNGTGEVYSEAQLNTAAAVCAAVLDGLYLPIDCMRHHHEWAPGRKPDIGGPAAGAFADVSGYPWNALAWGAHVQAVRDVVAAIG